MNYVTIMTVMEKTLFKADSYVVRAGPVLLGNAAKTQLKTKHGRC